MGNYINAKGRDRTYAAQWSGGHWQLQATINALNAKVSTFEAVSCPSTTLCVAVGQAAVGAFGETWFKGKWRLSLSPYVAYGGGLFSVTCLSISNCYAAGQRLGRGFIAHYENRRWFLKSLHRMPGSFRATALTHVSCAAVSECVAVGSRYNPSAKPGQLQFRTLALRLTGGHWAVMATPNH